MRLILFFLFSFFYCALFAQQSAVEISSETGLNEPFYLYINGVKQNEAPTTTLRIVNMPFEIYTAELQLANKPEKIKKLLFLQIGRVKNYLLTNTNNTFNLTEGPFFSDNKPTAGVTALQYKVNSEVLKELVSKSVSDVLVNNAPQRKSLFDDEAEEEIPASPTPVKTTINKTPEASLDKSQDKLRINADSLFKSLRMKNNSQAQLPEPCLYTLGHDDLRLLKIKIKETPQLKAKLALTGTTLNKKCISCAQLKELMRLLDGDELKIELYKQVYLNISDFYNRSDLYDIFYFENSIDELKAMQ